jgi:hypothetical protein
MFTNKIKRSKGRTPEFPCATLGGKPSGVLPSAVNDVAINENAIPKGISVEVDRGAFERFPGMDGHYESLLTENESMRLTYTPISPQSRSAKPQPVVSR